MEYKTRAETAALSRGTSYVTTNSAVTTSVDIQNALYEATVIHLESHREYAIVAIVKRSGLILRWGARQVLR